MRKIDEIILHCTATPEGREVTVAEIDNWHRQRANGRNLAARPPQTQKQLGVNN